jgi:alkylation response protein AidB-like acyl-CoA dehydrogenase
MNFELTEEQRAIRDMARDFAQNEMAQHAAGWDENKTFPEETLRAAAALGLAGLYVAAPGRRAGVRGICRRLSLDRGLFVRSQHGRLDDRPFRR